MICKLIAIVCFLACSLVSAQQNETALNVPMSAAVASLQNVPPQYAEKMQVMPASVEMKLKVNEPEKLVVSNVKPMQVTGLITASGAIFQLDDDKRSVGVVESRQHGQLLTPQPGEFICNYGSVVVYSDRPCENVMNIKKQKKQKPNKSVKTETDKETDQKQTTVASEQPQADENTDMATEMGTKDEDMKVEENKPMPQKNEKNKKKKKVKKTKKKPKNKNRRKQTGPNRIRVKTIRRRPINPQQQQQQPQQEQQQSGPLRRPQNIRRPRPRPRPQQAQQQQSQSQRRLQQRKRGQSALYTTSAGKLYELVEVVN